MGDVAGNTLLLPRLDIQLQTLQINSSSTTAPPVLPPRRNSGVKAEQELLTLACLCGFRLGIISGLVRNITDFFLEEDGFAAEEKSGGCFDGRRGGRPRGGGAAGTTGKSESTGPRKQHLSWYQSAGGRIYSAAP